MFSGSTAWSLSLWHPLRAEDALWESENGKPSWMAAESLINIAARLAVSEREPLLDTH